MGDSGKSLFRNITTICLSGTKIQTRGVFFGSNPLHYSVSLLLFQLFLASAVITLTNALFKPLGQPATFSQILGGMILGPSFLGRNDLFTVKLFPARSLILLDIMANFGIMFYVFLLGVQMEPSLLRKSGKREFAIGISAVLVPLIISFSFSMIMTGFTSIDAGLAKSLAATGAAESIIVFPTVARYLSDLEILNSELGRLALSSSMVGGLLSFLLMTVTVLCKEGMFPLLVSTAAATMMIVFILFLARPALLWVARRNPEGRPFKEEFVYAIMLGVLSIGLLCQTLGLNLLFGPLILGLAIPSGPPLGSALMEKLDLMISWMFMPLYFLMNGLGMNIFAVRLKNFMVVLLFVLVCSMAKLLGALLPSVYFKMPLRDAISLGLILNAQGVLEVGLFVIMGKVELLHEEAYVVMCVSMLFLTGAITPLLRYLYNPSRRYVVYKKRTILLSRPDSELRVLFCVHDQRNVPAIINLIEASNPTKRSPIAAYILHLMELAGRATPLLISHKANTRVSSTVTPSEPIINAFRHYEKRKEGIVSVHPFSSISPFATMHDDICTVALENKTSLVLVPFHKHYSADSMPESATSGFRIVNNNVLDKAPCSVGILIDRGLVQGSRSFLATRSSYRVAILFLGGADDREALALGARMSGHPNINLTVIRLLENGNVNDYTTETKLDNEVVSDFRFGMADNDRAMYIEEVVMDASGTISVIRSMENNYELIIVGRRHDRPSSLIMGLTDWNDFSELGVFGDLMASRDFAGKTNILVLQQHDNVGAGLQMESPENHSTVSRDLYSNMASDEMTEEEAEDVPIQRKSA